MPANLENSAVATDWKSSASIPIPKKGNAKEFSNYRTIALSSHASKVMLKVLQARLQWYVNWEIPDVQAGFRKRQRKQRSKSQYPLDHRKNKRVLEKYLLLLYWLHQSLWFCGSQQTKILEEMGIPDHLPASWEICMQVKKQQLKLDM